jgi:phage terminase Nu1 subunit (DNA packaging protein)
MEHYLIGKWADVKHSFETLKTMAIKRYRLTRENDLKKQIKNHQRELEDMDNHIFDRFGA